MVVDVDVAAATPAEETVSAKQSQSGPEEVAGETVSAKQSQFEPEDVADAPTPAAESFSAKQSQSEAEEVAGLPTPAAETLSAKQSQFGPEEAADAPTPVEEALSAKQSQSGADGRGATMGTPRGRSEEGPRADTDEAELAFAVGPPSDAGHRPAMSGARESESGVGSEP